MNVSADLSVLVIGVLLAWSFASQLLPANAPGFVGTVYWSVAIVGTLLFLAALLGHELAHAVVARRNGVGVEGITLWLFGGVATLESDPPGPGAEFRIAAAGPAASVILGVLSWGAGLGLDAIGGPRAWVVMLAYLGLINVFLAVFNLLPGAPLDGGRILGSVLWKIRGDRATGLEGAAKTGKAIAVLLIVAGLAQVWYFENPGSLWTVLIGFFLFNAARSEAAFYGAERALSGMTVAGAMLSPVQVAKTWNTVSQAVDGPFAHSTQNALPVVDATGQVRGLLLMEQVKRLQAEQWATTDCAQVMLPIEGMPMLDPAEAMTEVIPRIGNRGHALVLSDRKLVGMIGPAEVQRAVELSTARRRSGRRGSTAGPPPTPQSGPSQEEWHPPAQH